MPPVFPPHDILVLDGPLGTELERRGLPLPAPAWSARALTDAPELLLAIHRDYAAAGAEVHTAATFRTTARALRDTPWAAEWAALARKAVTIARRGAAGRGRVAGSIAPLEDCFSPELTPEDAALETEHRALAEVLADAGAELLLVETMPTLRELLAAVRAAVATGLPVWAALTLGPRGDFFSAAEVRQAHRLCGELGADVLLLNCSAPESISAALAAAFPQGVPAQGPALGAYANDLFGRSGAWTPPRYAAQAREWLAAGVTVVGGCCGMGPPHVAALAELRDAR